MHNDLSDVRYSNHSRTSNVRQSHLQTTCDFRMVVGMEPEEIRAALKRFNVPHDRIAAVIGRDRTAATKLVNGGRNIKANEVAGLLSLIREFKGEHIGNTPDEPDTDPLRDYVEVDILPTYAGMGGGGTGDASAEKALLPRTLLRELKAEAADLLVIDLRGDSMAPVFLDGDQAVINRRLVNLAQPGPFALWDGDGYVVKNVERDPQTRKIRVFSENPKYRDIFFDEDDDRLVIMGRPVWFARRV